MTQKDLLVAKAISKTHKRAGFLAKITIGAWLEFR
jgi:hypothetical protein